MKPSEKIRETLVGIFDVVKEEKLDHLYDLRESLLKTERFWSRVDWSRFESIIQVLREIEQDESIAPIFRSRVNEAYELMIDIRGWVSDSLDIDSYEEFAVFDSVEEVVAWNPSQYKIGASIHGHSDPNRMWHLSMIKSAIAHCINNSNYSESTSTMGWDQFVRTSLKGFISSYGDGTFCGHGNKVITLM